MTPQGVCRRALGVATLVFFFAGLAAADTGTSLGDRSGEGSTPFTGLAQAPEANLFTGSLGTRIAIDIPPGRKNMTPQLALDYASNRGASVFGHGWDLPLGRIERSTKWGVPNCTSGHDDDYVLILPGGNVTELVNDPPGSNRYRPRVERSFLEAELDAAANRWMVRDRAGLGYTFGAVREARVATYPGAPLLVVNPDGSCDFTSVWMLTSAEDGLGSGFEVEWNQFGNVPVPSEIGYGGNAHGIEHFYHVYFGYGLRPDQPVSHRYGVEQTLQVRLLSIGVRTDVPAPGDNVRTYLLHYDENEIFDSLLTAVEASDQPAQVFAYSPLLSAHDEATVPVAVPAEHTHLRVWDDSGEVKRSIIDINGDGILDLVFGDRFPWTVHFGEADGTDQFGFDPVPTTWSGPATSLGQIRNVWVSSGPCDDNGWACSVADTFDINGDGYADYVIASDLNQPWRVYRGGGRPGGGWGFDPTPQYWPAPDRIIRRVKNGRTVRDVVDVNGDGLVDFVDVVGGVWSVHLNNGVGFDADPLPYFPAPVDSIALQSDGGNRTYHITADFNGDGLVDLLRHVDAFDDPLCSDFPWDEATQQYVSLHDCLLVYFGDGQGFSVEPRVVALPYGANGVSSQHDGEVDSDLVDLNGDGLPDWVERRVGDDQWLVLLNVGGALEPVSFTASGAREAVATRLWVGGSGPIREVNGHSTDADLVDLNGDGFLDYVRAGDTEWDVQLNTRRERPAMLVMMENGLGGTNTIVYAPSTQFLHLGGDGIPDLPFVTWVVAGTRLNDGLCTPPPGADVFSPDENPCIEGGHEIISRFRYEDGRLAVEYELDGVGNPLRVIEREFRGFRAVTRRDSDGNESLTVFAQDSISEGQALLVARFAGSVGSGALVRWESNSWAARPTGVGRDQLWLLQNTRVTADLGSEAHVLTTRNESVDAYGNVLHTWTEGTALSRVETFAEYAVPLDVDGLSPRNKPHHSYTRDASGLLEEKRFYYDDVAYGTVAAGNLIKIEAWLDTASSWLATETEYDGYGNVVTVRAANGAETHTDYEDGTGAYLYPIRVTNALGQDVISLIDYRYGSPAFTWGANGVETAIGYTYDHAGRLICEVHPGDSFTDCTIATTYSFATRAGELSSVAVDRRQSEYTTPRRSVSYFDALGRRRYVDTRQVVDGDLQTVRREEVEFDAGGRVAQRSYPYVVGSTSGSGSTAFDYHLNGSAFIDPLGRVFRTTHSDGTSTRIEYAGPVSRSFDEQGEKTVRHVDALGRVVREEIYAGAALYSSSTSIFDGMGRLVEVYENDASTPLKTITYDTLGRKIVLLDRDSGVWTYGYDAVGNLLYQDDPKPNQHVQFCYDAMNRPLRRCALPEDFRRLYSCTQSCDADESRYTYDDPAVPFSTGRLTSVVDAAGELRILAYDARGRRRAIERDVAAGGTTATARFDYEYNDSDEVTAITYPDGEIVTTTYDESGQPIELFSDSGAAYVTNVLYDAFGRATWIAHGNGANDSRVYGGPGNRHRLATISTFAEGAIPLTLLYDYDARGQIRAIADLDTGPKTNGASYEYDRLGRLTRFDSAAAGIDRTYEYDAWGNLTRKGSLLLSYGDPYAPQIAPHHVALAGGESIAYDANGNRTSGPGGQTYAYNGEDKLTQIDLATGASIRLRYDYEGQQRARIVDDGVSQRVTRYFNDLVHTTSDGETIKFYFLGGMRIAARHTHDVAWQTAGLFSRPIQVAAAWVGRPAVVVRLSPGAQLYGLVALCLLTGGLAALPSRRRRRVVGVRLRGGTSVGLALLFLMASTPWPWMVRPVSAACGPPTPPPNQRIDHFHSDHLRSTLLVTDAGGAVVEHIRYFPYGELRGRWDAQGVPLGVPPAGEVRYGYTGYEQEPSSGLLYAGARFYDPVLASFLTPDAAAEFANPYAYVGWDPVSSSDPTGNCETFCSLLVAFVVGFLIGAVEAAATGASFTDVLKAAVIGGASSLASYGVAGPGFTALGKLGGWGAGVSHALRLAAGGYQLYGTIEAFRQGEYVAGARGVLGILATAYGGLSTADNGIGAQSSQMPGAQYLNPSEELPEVARASYRPSKFLEPFPSAPVSGTRATVDGKSFTILGVKVEVGTAYAIDSAGTQRVFDIFAVGFETEIFQISAARGLQITNAATVDELTGPATTIGGAGNPSFADVGAEITVTPRYRGYTVYFGAAYGVLPVGAYGIKENWTPHVE